MIWYTDAAAKVYELQLDACFLVDFSRGIEHKACGVDEGIGMKLVGDDHAVETEAFNAALLRDFIRLNELIMRETVFCFLRASDDVVACNACSRVVTEGKHFREAGVLFEVVDMGYVVEVYDSTKLNGTLKFICRSVVGGEHNVFAPDVCHMGELEFSNGGAVRACAFFFHDFQERGVRSRFDGKVLAEGRRP